jgi:isoamylase
VAFTRQLLQIRADHPVCRRCGWFTGRPLQGASVPDVAWFRTDGVEMADDDWRDEHAKALAVFLNGEAIDDVDGNEQQIVDESFLLLFNGHHEPHAFTLPASAFGAAWRVILQTSAAQGDDQCEAAAGSMFSVAARTVIVLSRAASAN